MKNFMLFFMCCSVLFSCGSTAEQENPEPEGVNATMTQKHVPEVSNKLRQFMKDLTGDNYIYKNLTFAKGNLDDALKQAEHENKYLYVITTLGDCSICNMTLRLIDMNRKEEVNETLFDDFLFYQYDFYTTKDRYLFWAVNDVGAPNSLIFKDSKLINFYRGAKEVQSSAVLKNINEVNQNSIISSRLNLKGKSVNDFINNQIKAYKVAIGSNRTEQELSDAYKLIVETIDMEETYFTNYIAKTLETKLNLPSNRVYKEFNDEYSLDLFEGLN